MNSIWLAGLSEEDAEDLEKRLKRNKILLDKLYEICYNKVKNISRPSKKDYESPSWSHKQAHENGELAAYQFVMDLVTLDQRD